MLKTKYNTDKTKLENKILDISSLATKTALTTVENKIRSANDLVKKTDYNNKVTEIENKIPDISYLAMKAALTTVNRKVTEKNKSDHLLVQNELNKLKTFDSGYFIGKSHFEEDGLVSHRII